MADHRRRRQLLLETSFRLDRYSVEAAFTQELISPSETLITPDPDAVNP